MFSNQLRSEQVRQVQVTKTTCRRQQLLAAAVLFGVGITGDLQAVPLYWNGTGASWGNANNWSTSSSAASPNPSASPTTGDTAIFNANLSPALGAQTISLDGNRTVDGVQFGGSQYSSGVPADTIQSGGGGNFSLAIGSGGITNAAWANLDTINAAVILSADQTWSAASGSLTINGPISGTANLSIGAAVFLAGTNNNLNGNITVNSGGHLTVQPGSGVNSFNNLTVNGIIDATAIGINASDSSHSITFGSGSIFGVQSTIATAKSISFGGNHDLYLNGHNLTLSGAVTQSAGVISLHQNATVTLSGSSDNTGLTFTTQDSSVLVLSKSSSSSIHSIGAGGLSIGGTSTVQLAGTGGDQIYDSAPVSVYSGATFDLNGRSEAIDKLNSNTLITGGTITNTGSSGSLLTVGANNGTATFGGVIQNGSGGMSFAKIGTGTQILTNSSSYTGTTSINGGTLTLDFSQNASTPASILSSQSVVSLGGGTLNVKGAATGTTVQSVAGLTLNAGASAISVNSNSGGGTVLNLNAITASPNAGAAVDFTPPSGTQSATNGITTTTANSAGNILGGWATVGGQNWAVSASNGAIAGNISPLSGYDGNVWGAGKNTDVSSNINPSSGSTTNSVRFDAAGTNAIALTGTNTIASGGILVTNSSTTNIPTISGGNLTSGNGQSLVVHQFNVTNPLTIGSSIVDAGIASPIGLTKSGAGALVLSAVNSYTGATNINRGSITVNNTATLGVNSDVTLSGGSSLTFANAGPQITVTPANAVASSNGQPAANAFDGNSNSRWETAWSDPQWIYIDLGATYSLNAVKIDWETADANTFQIQTSGNGTTPNTSGWTTVASVVNQNPALTANHTGLLTYNLNAGASGRYVAMYGTVRNTGYGYSIWEMQIFQAAAALTQSIGSLSSSDSTTSISLASQTTLNIGANNTSTTFAGGINGGGAITKVGNGTLTLSGVGSYTGSTTISAGTIRANNATSSLGSGSVSVVSGGTLGGAGKIANGTNAISIAPGGTITAGADANTTGTLTTGSETWSGGGAYRTKIAAPGTGGQTVGSGASGTTGTTGTWDDLSMSGLDLSSAGGSNQPFKIVLANSATLSSAYGQYSWTIAQITGGAQSFLLA